MSLWLLALLPSANAQSLPGVDAQHFRPSLDARSFQWVDDASRREFGASEARIIVDYSNGAMGAIDPTGVEKQVLDQVVGVDLVGALHLGPLRVGAHIPTYGVVTSDFREDTLRGIGDVAADVKLTFLDPEIAQIGLAFTGRFTAPTSNLDLPLGSDGATWSAGMVADADFVDWRLAFNVGLRGLPSLQQGNLVVGNAAWFRAGLAITPTDDAGFSLEVAGQASLTQGDPLGVPVEVLAGAYRRVAPSVTVRAGLGTGVTSGLGSPTFRGVVGLSFHPQRDGDMDFDLITDKRDNCPTLPEDLDGFEDSDGCPDPDNDGDGVLDGADACANSPEDMDGVKDDDGCPESATFLTVEVESDGQPLQAAQVRLKRGPARPEGLSGSPIVVAPGVWEVTVYAPGLSSVTERVLIEDNEPKVHKVTLERLEGYSWVELTMTDSADLEVDGRVSVDGSVWQDVVGGSQRVSLPTGEFVLRAEAFGYQPLDLPLNLPEGSSDPIQVKMFPAWGTVHLVLLGPDGQPVNGVWLDEDTGGPIPIGSQGIDNFVQEGEHTVKVAVEGYGEQEIDMIVVRDQITEVVVNLSESGAKPAPKEAPAPAPDEAPEEDPSPWTPVP